MREWWQGDALSGGKTRAEGYGNYLYNGDIAELAGIIISTPSDKSRVLDGSHRKSQWDVKEILQA